MTAAHLFASDVAGSRVEVTGEDARHALRVLRLKVGERVTISDGEGAVVDAIVAEAGSTLVAEVATRRRVDAPSPPIVVAQGLPKAAKFDEITQHLVEIGVDEIIPLRTHRSVARWDGPTKLARARTIAREAAKQSRRAWLPRVADPVSVTDLPLRGLAIVLHEEATDPLVRVLAEATEPELVTLCVGPEGGFSPEEVAGLVDRGGTAATLGPQILRTETAALVAATLVLGRFGRFG